MIGKYAMWRKPSVIWKLTDGIVEIINIQGNQESYGDHRYNLKRKAMTFQNGGGIIGADLEVDEYGLM